MIDRCSVPDGAWFVAHWVGGRGVYERVGDRIVGVINAGDEYRDGYDSPISSTSSAWGDIELIDPTKAAVFDMLARHGQIDKALRLIGLEPAT